MFSAITALGPGERDFKRLHDLAESLLVEKSNIFQFHIIYDHGSESHKKASKIFNELDTIWTANPRAPSTSGWEGGHTLAILDKLDSISAPSDLQYVLKLDTDSIALNPFHTYISNIFSNNPDAGAIGSYKNYPHRERNLAEDFMAKSALGKMIKPFTIWRRLPARPTPYIQTVFNRDDRIFRNHMLMAIKNGYRIGENVQGGAYALSADFIRKFQLTKKPSLKFWAHRPLTEDSVTAIFNKSLGFNFLNAIDPNGGFGVSHLSLPFSLDEMLQKKYGFIHPIKSKDEATEEKMRASIRSSIKKTLKGLPK